MSVTHTDRPLLDVLASLARTALDDPDGLPADEEQRLADCATETDRRGAVPVPPALALYAIDRLDEIIETLSPSLHTQGNCARSATTLGQHLAALADENAAVADDPNAVEEDAVAHKAAAVSINRALDHIDAAIATLKRDDPE